MKELEGSKFANDSNEIQVYANDFDITFIPSIIFLSLKVSNATGIVVVKLLDNFKHSGPNGQHACMVFEYLGDNLLTFIKYTNYWGMPIHRVKDICFHILVGLDYLHKQLSIVYTDLKSENILLMAMIDPAKGSRKSVAPLILLNSKKLSAPVV